MNKFDNRSMIYDPATGDAFIVPTEEELREMLVSKDPSVIRDLLLMSRMVGYPVQKFVAVPFTKREHLLRQAIEKLTGKPLTRLAQQSVPAQQSVAPTTKAKKAELRTARLVEVKKLLAKGLRQYQIAEKLGLSRPYVCQLLKSA